MKYGIRDVLKQLNDRNPSELSAVDNHELRRFEVLCESWARFGEAELARRETLPRGQPAPNPAGDLAAPSAVRGARILPHSVGPHA
jgi:hypothetical protein